jgi:hypothetical protein
VKNARVKLFGRKIVVYPQDVSGEATMDWIAGSFAKSPTFTDNGTLGKWAIATFLTLSLYDASIFSLCRGTISTNLDMSSLWGYGVKLSKISISPGALEFSFLKHFCISFMYTIYVDHSREDQLRNSQNITDV